MRFFFDSQPLRAIALGLALLATGAAPAAIAPARRLPAIVFVSRNPIPGEPGAIPGLGPHQRAAITGGRLLVREPNGRVRELLPPGAFYDVSDPSVSPDAKTIAFAAVQHPDSAWRIWLVGVDGTELRQLTFDRSGRMTPERFALFRVRHSSFERGRPLDEPFAQFDDFDPCWTSGRSSTDLGRIVFASTRFPQRAQYADVPVTNLFIVPVRPGRPTPSRLTTERNGAEEPAMDWKAGKIVFARWWFNRYQATNDSSGLTTDPDRAIPRDTANVWQVMEIAPSRRPSRLVAADLRTRRGSMGYQPAVMPNGTIAAVFAANLGLSPKPGGTGIHLLTRGFGPERRLAGAIVSGAAGDAYSGAQGLAPPSACSPVAMPDGRILFSYAPGGGSDFGLFVMNADGSRITRVVDLPGTLELDAAPVVVQPQPPAEDPLTGDDFEDPAGNDPSVGSKAVVDENAYSADFPVDDLRYAWTWRTFRFHDLDVFADGPKRSPSRGAAPRIVDARIRFFALLARPAREGGDTAVLVREVPVGRNGEVNESGLPADMPLFEQLIDSHGHVLMTAHGPAHVAGSNAGVAGLATRCVGCHLGHSTLPVPAARVAVRRVQP